MYRVDTDSGKYSLNEFQFTSVTTWILMGSAPP